MVFKPFSKVETLPQLKLQPVKASTEGLEVGSGGLHGQCGQFISVRALAVEGETEAEGGIPACGAEAGPRAQAL